MKKRNFYYGLKQFLPVFPIVKLNTLRLNLNSLIEHVSLKKQALLLEEVQKLNQENAEKSCQQLTSGYLDLEAGVSPKDEQPDTPACSLVDYLREDSQVAEKVAEKLEVAEVATEEEAGERAQDAEVSEKKAELVVEDEATGKEEDKLLTLEEKKEEDVSSGTEGSKATESPAAVEDTTASR